MNPGFLSILGGLGLFLLGMAVMTEGLRDLAGDALQRWLARCTRNPTAGVATGALSTALVQSSSVTTVIAVGFVGAGLLSFSQALGIVFGANIGTTVTGWLVALLGFKLSLTQIVLPLILVGAVMRLFGRHRFSAAGFALAGFGLVFAGIAMLQSGLEGFQDVVTPANFPPNTLVGRFLLVLLGVLFTLVTQSSSVGVATAITAVHVGNLSLAQAAAVVIGTNVGTTFTAAMAAVGGNTDARRTGVAHVIYNIMTGVGAFFLLPLYLWGWETLAPSAARSDPELALVAFHTLFNALGVAAVLPFTRHFAALIIRIVPKKETALLRRLDPSLLQEPGVAIENVRATLFDVTQVVFAGLVQTLRGGGASSHSLSRLAQAEQAVEATRHYLGQFGPASTNGKRHSQQVTAFHVLDHLDRLIHRCRERKATQTVRALPELWVTAETLAAAVHGDVNQPQRLAEAHDQLRPLWHQVDRDIEPYRRQVIQDTAMGVISNDAALDHLDASRWLRRVTYHAWRIVDHLQVQDSVSEFQEAMVVEDE